RRARGLEQDELSRDPWVVFAVRACTLEFRKPARFNDLLAVTVRVAHRGGASLTFAQQVRREGEVLCEGEVRIACLDAQRFTPRPLPPALIDRLPPETA
ncbi:MAG: thioesterase family protein, partial [Pseudomonadota bacterium]